MVLEFGDEYIRFHTSGATLLYSDGAAWLTATAYVVGDIRALSGRTTTAPSRTRPAPLPPISRPASGAMPSDPNIYEIPSPYAEADLFAIHYAIGRCPDLVHPGYAPRELRRYGATDWRLVSIAFVPAVSAPSVSVKGNARGLTTSTSTSSRRLMKKATESAASNPARARRKPFRP